MVAQVFDTRTVRGVSAATPSRPDPDLAHRITELEEQLAAALDELRVLRRKPRLGLVWEDQSEAVEDQMMHELPVLTRVPSRSIGESDVPHLLIEGDNLHALACLQYTHAGRVDVIYLDPPYNTRSKEGDRFRYNDHYVDPDDEWRHSKWLSFMDRRIRLAKELLAPGGFLAVSIDDNEMAHLRLLLDSHFGEDGLVANVVVETGNANGPKTTHKDKTIFKVKEYLLVYRRPSDAFLLNPRYEEVEEYDSKYSQIATAAGIVTKAQHMATAGMTEADIIKAAKDGSLFVYRCMSDFTDKTDRFLEAIEAGEVEALFEFPTRAVLRAKTATNTDVYLLHHKDTRKVEMIVPLKSKISPRGKILKLRGDLWKGFNKDYGNVDSEGGVSFKNGKKAVRLLQDVVDLHPKKDAVVLDFFAGSGTTGHAVAALNAADGGTRQAILVTNDESSICSEVTYPRLKGVLTGKLANGKTQDALPGALRGYRCEFVKISRNRDAMLRRLSGRAADIISIRENTYDTVDEQKGRYIVLGNGGRRIVVWCDWADDGLAEVLAAHADADERRLYMFGFGESVDAEVAAAHPEWEVEALPEPLRAALERAYRRSSAR
jgi:adenine-specific DNA-methyltransferase